MSVYCKSCKHVGSVGRYTGDSRRLCHHEPTEVSTPYVIEQHYTYCIDKNTCNDCQYYERGLNETDRWGFVILGIVIAFMSFMVWIGSLK